jgi:hypothetical protein
MKIQLRGWLYDPEEDQEDKKEKVRLLPVKLPYYYFI